MKRKSPKIFSFFLLFIILGGTLEISFQNMSNYKRCCTANTVEIENAVGLFAPRIDGHIHSDAPQGYLNEWEDASKTQITFIDLSGTPIDVDLYTKVVSGILYVAFRFPEQLEQVELKYDRDNNQQLSNGDIKLSLSLDIQAETIVQSNFSISIYTNEGWTYLSTYLKLNHEQGALAQSSIGTIAAHYINDQSTTTIEIRYSNYVLENLVKTIARARIFSLVSAEEQNGASNYSYDIDLATDVSSYTSPSLKFAVPAVMVLLKDVGIDHVEATQAIQNETNGMPLVRNKPTLLRVFVENPYGSSTEVEVNLRAYGLTGFWITYLGTISKIYNAPSSILATPLNRENIDHSANFLLPDEWTSHSKLILDAEVNPISSWDPKPDDNELSSLFSFHKTYNMNIYYIRINEEGTETIPVLRSPEFVANQFGNFTHCYPTTPPTAIELGWGTFGLWSGSPDNNDSMDDGELLGDLATLAQQIWIQQYILKILGFPYIMIDQIHGFRTKGYFGGLSGGWKRFAAWTNFGSSAELTMAHEINHNIGYGKPWRYHVPGCGTELGTIDSDWVSLYSDGVIHQPGWYPGATSLIPSSCPELMTYCQSGYFPTKWVSDYRWEILVDRLLNWIEGEPIPDVLCQLMNTRTTTNNYSMRIVNGYFYKNGSVILRPSFALPLPTRIDPLELPDAPNPTHYLIVDYQNGSQQQISLQENFTTPDGDIPISPFNIMLRDDGEITKLSLVNQTMDTLVYFDDTGFSSSGTITAPSTIARNTATTINWSLTLTNRTNVYAQLQYSHDNTTWYPLGRPTLRNGITITFDKQPGSRNAGLRLLLTDGVKTQVITGPKFILSNLPPSTSIQCSRNLPKRNLTSGSVISLFAQARDPETGDITNSSLSWKVTQGAKTVLTASGSYLNTRLFQTGLYQITVTATDSDGQTSIDSIEIQVISPAYLKEEQWTEFQKLLGSQTPVTTSFLPGVVILTIFAALTILYRKKRNKRS